MPQFLRPTSTAIPGTATANGAATQHECINEVTPDGDTTYVLSPIGNQSFYRLSDPDAPPVYTDHIIRVTAKLDTGAASGTLSFTIWVETSPGSFTPYVVPAGNALSVGYATYEYELTTTEASSLVGLYSDLVLMLESSIPGGDIRITQAEFEVPAAAISLPTGETSADWVTAGATRTAVRSLASGATSGKWASAGATSTPAGASIASGATFATWASAGATIASGAAVPAPPAVASWASAGAAVSAGAISIVAPAVAAGTWLSAGAFAVVPIVGRARDVNTTGTGGFGFDPIISKPVPPTPFTHGVPCYGSGTNRYNVWDADVGSRRWAPQTRLTWFDATCGAYVDAEFRIETRGNAFLCDGTWEYRYVIDMRMTLYRSSAGFPTEFVVVGDQQVGPWTAIFTDCGAGVFAIIWDVYNVYWNNAIGSFTMSEDATLTDETLVVGVPGGGNKQERKRVTGFTLNASCDFHFVLTQTRVFHPFAFPPGTPDICVSAVPLDFSLSGTLTAAEPVGYSRALSNSEYKRRLELLDQGLHLDWHATLSYNDSSIDCTRASFGSLNDGHAQMTGGWDSISYHWNGTEDDWHPQIMPNGAPKEAPLCSAECLPSWAAEFLLRSYAFNGGSVPMQIDLRCFTFIGGLATPSKNFRLVEFPSGTVQPYPLTGEAHTVLALCFNGSLPGHPPAHVEQNEPLFFPTEADRLPTAAVSTIMFCSPNPDWCDLTGRYFHSHHWPFGRGTNQDFIPRRFPLHLTAPFPQGELAFAATHKFTLFDDAANWQVHSESEFLADNPGYSSDVLISEVGGALRVQVNSAKAVVRMPARRLKNFAYRYAKLRLKGDGPGLRMRFGLGTQTCFQSFPPVAWFPQYGWNAATVGTNAYTDVTLDLALPDLEASGACGAVVWSASGKLLHPADTYPVGADVWLEFLDAGVYTLDYLEGYYETGGDREELRLWAPLDGRGDILSYQSFEQSGTVINDLYDAVRLFPNGVHGLTDRTLADTLSSYWVGLKARLDSTANDTGVTVAPAPVDDFLFFSHVHNSEFTRSKAGQPFVIHPVAGTPFSLYAQARAAGCFGYYGMGNLLTGAYGRTLRFEGDWIWNGSAVGNVGRTGAASPVLHDNDTGAVLASDTSDDDGFWELHAKYGVIFPYSVPRYPTGPPATVPFDFGAQEYTLTGFDPTYTAIGKRLNSHWVKGFSPVDGSGYVLFGGRRMDIVILDRYPLLYDLKAAPTGSNPHNISTGFGVYERVHVSSGRIVYSRADEVIPQFQQTTQVTLLTSTGKDRFPRIAADRYHLEILFERDEAVYSTRSPDDGRTWSAPTLWNPAATKPFISVDRSGTVLRAAYTAGQIVVTRQDAGDLAESDPFWVSDGAGVPLIVEDDTFALAPLPETPGRWALAANVSGLGGPTLWASGDDGETWGRLGSLVIPGGVHANVAVGRRDGALYVAAVVGNEIHAARFDPGELAPGPLLALRDAAGTALMVAEDTFGLSEAYEQASRAVLAIVKLGEEDVTEHWSAEDIARFEQV